LFVSPAEYASFVNDVYVDEGVGDGPRCLIVDLTVGPMPADMPSPGSLPVVVLAVGPSFGATGPEWIDAVVGPEDVDAVVGQVMATPIAAAALCVLLRGTHSWSVEQGLAAESAVYSTLQAGPEFAAWRATAPYEPAPDVGPTVRAERVGDQVTVTLQRPARHNAISSRLRDELVDALRVPLIDESVERVTLRGDGPSFCSGGDLAEFGMRSDPATAHLLRLARSPARSLSRLSSRTTALIHGATLGGGLELAAFAGRVIAHPDTVVGLPELSLGLIPGAGGTVSLARRIGRQRVAALALSCRSVTAECALEWGIVDEIDARAFSRAGSSPGRPRVR
jgi:enoyl-CoA hydratase/carnithine racemase